MLNLFDNIHIWSLDVEFELSIFLIMDLLKVYCYICNLKKSDVDIMVTQENRLNLQT